MKLVEANNVFMISKRRHLEFMASDIIHKEKMIIREMIAKINKNRELQRITGNIGQNNEHITSIYTIDGTRIEATVIYDGNRNSEENLFYFGIGSKPPYPIRCWNNCPGENIPRYIQEYIDNVIMKKKIII